LKMGGMKASEYERSVEDFLGQLSLEEYRHLAGRKDTFETEGIFREYAELFSRSAVLELLQKRQDRPGRHLAEFAAHNHIERQIRDLTEEIANQENAAEVLWEGGRQPFHSACRQLFSEPDRKKRRELEKAISEVVARQNNFRVERIRRQGKIARELGFSDYCNFCEQLSGVSLQALEVETRRFLQETEEVYRAKVTAALEKEGLSLEEATLADLRWVVFAPRWESLFPVDKLLSAAATTLGAMGIELARQKNLHFDLEPRPRKYPRAFCCPVRVPGEVWVVVAPRGGCIDYLAFFHELGHAEHFSHIDPQLPVAYRWLGDKAVSEGFAFVFQALVLKGKWLQENLQVPELPADLTEAWRLVDFCNARRCAARLRFGLELHRRNCDPGLMADRYAQLMEEATLVKASPENYLFDLDDGFYSATYLRAWVFDAGLRGHLRSELGGEWFLSPQAGELLGKLWRRGQEKTAEELAEELRPGSRPEPLHRRLVERMLV
jgi:hypothetical protein